MNLFSGTGAELVLIFVTALVPFAPTEAVLIGAGAFVMTGALPLPVVIAVGAIGCALSDLINYRAGQLFGTRLLRRIERTEKGAGVAAWIGQQLVRRPVPILVAGRFLPAGGLIGAVLCGASGFGWRKFVMTSALGASVWTAYATGLGVLGGALVQQPVLGMVFGVVLGLVLGAVSGALTRFVTDRQPQPAVEAPLAVRA